MAYSQKPEACSSSLESLKIKIKLSLLYRLRLRSVRIIIFQTYIAHIIIIYVGFIKYTGVYEYTTKSRF